MSRFDLRRTRLLGLGIAALVGLGLTETSGMATATPPTTDVKAGAIFERQFTMQQLDDDSELLGNILAGIEPTTKLAETTRAIAKEASEAVDNFRKPLPGGRSKAEVWSKHDDFMQRMESFARNAQAMAKAGETGNVEAVTNLMVDAMPCKQCRDLYRAPKPPA